MRRQPAMLVSTVAVPMTIPNASSTMFLTCFAHLALLAPWHCALVSITYASQAAIYQVRVAAPFHAAAFQLPTIAATRVKPAFPPTSAVPQITLCAVVFAAILPSAVALRMASVGVKVARRFAATGAARTTAAAIIVALRAAFVAAISAARVGPHALTTNSAVRRPISSAAALAALRSALAATMSAAEQTKSALATVPAVPGNRFAATSVAQPDNTATRPAGVSRVNRHSYPAARSVPRVWFRSVVRQTYPAVEANAAVLGSRETADS
jgi:hypothetical protein